MSIDLDAIKMFFDPHPGFIGATIPIPTAVKNIADKLNGKCMPLREAIDSLKTVTDGILTIKSDWIALEISESDGKKHVFRVIRFS